MDDLRRHIFLLFYALASADGTIRSEEVKPVDLSLLKPWFPELSHQLMLEIWRQLQQQQVTAKMAFENFKKFYCSHLTLFDTDLKNKLAEVCGNIAVAYAGNNKSELTLLSKLYFLFNDKSLFGSKSVS